MDRLRRELDNCSRLAKEAKGREDREFWQHAAERCKKLLDHYDQPSDSRRDEVTRLPTKH